MASQPQRGTHQAAVSPGSLRELVAAAGRVLHAQGLADYLGHCSARVPGTDRVIIKPKHSATVRSPASLGPQDMVVIDLDGNLVEGRDQPPSERFIHTEIYRARPDVSAVVHTHQESSTVLGVLGAELLPVLHVPAVLTGGGDVATWPCPLLVETPALGRELAAALGGGQLCHLQGHGIVSVAGDPRVAVLAAIAMEQLARVNLTILQTGLRPRVITRGELDRLATQVASVEGRWAYYLQASGLQASGLQAAEPPAG